MARYNEINVGRYNRFLQKLLGMKGGPPAPQLSSDISTSINLFNGVENRYLEAWQRYSVTLNAPAVAANGSAVQIRNPASSNMVAVIEMLLFNFIQPATLHLSNGPTNVDLPSQVGPANSRLDPRGSQTPVCSLTFQNSVAALAGDLLNVMLVTSGLTATPQNFIFTEDQELPLLPGDAYRVAATAVNVQVIITLMWRERFLEEGERT
jgi:hypothetical protein